MLSQAEREMVVRSWRLVVPIADTAADLFYRRLFELRPDYRAYFPEDMTGQKKKLVHMLAFIVRSMDWPDSAWNDDVSPDEDLFLVVLALGRRHTEIYGIPDEAYAPVGEALLWTLDYGIGKDFDAQLRSAWARLYGLVARVMKMGVRSIADRSKAGAQAGGRS
ncbi:MAG: nitric oxide dioxygenase [Polyangiaceae bacterium]|nr:nitric oxide dioxygenase [Polyangiaceae bacterium]